MESRSERVSRPRKRFFVPCFIANALFESVCEGHGETRKGRTYRTALHQSLYCGNDYNLIVRPERPQSFLSRCQKPYC
jgi:hypothetical protein